jgi:nucleotide-binding universal stress UspA family protein
MKVNNVLIPIDRSDFSLTILPWIEQFLMPDRNALIFLHVAEEPTPTYRRSMGVDGFADHLKKLREGISTELTEELQPLTVPLRAKGYAVAVEVAFGEPIPEIERFIARHKIDLLAMTTHGRNGLGRVLFGSVAQHLLQQLNMPILLFHPLMDNRGVEQV